MNCTETVASLWGGFWCVQILAEPLTYILLTISFTGYKIWAQP